ncbi:hypothetical protein PanWU01x14_144720, partial [Parasponia andersonii]
TPHASESQGRLGYGGSNLKSSSSHPDHGRNNKERGKVTGEAYAFTGADDTQDCTS